MSVKWTEEQNKVIHLGHRNLLVSAAAGSGKTAVLVERIIHMLTRKENPVDVDELLVVTFTEAAAAEMKDRIRAAIEKKIEEEPENEDLRRQATLIHSARITTIHSFCLSVIREHFHVIDIDPGFRIGEEGELNLLKQDVLSEMLEQHYQRGEQKFLDFIESYGGNKSDKNIEDLILKIYEFSRSYPDPNEWLSNCVRSYQMKTREELETSVFYKCVTDHVRKYMESAGELIRRGIEICREPYGPYMYESALEFDRMIVDLVLRANRYEEYFEIFHDLKWARLAPNRDASVSDEKAFFVRTIRESVKKMVGDLGTIYFSQNVEDVLGDLANCLPMMEQLAELVLDFSRSYEDAKRTRNMIDFDDMQQYALRILTEEKEGKIVPSASAKEYQEQFEEVMIDEYQDSNLIQELILTSVSRIWSGRYNIFMVGDVKQSIYRFRLSRPELFMEKYDRYSVDEGNEQKINLRKNFRSRAEVLDAANYIFKQIMTRSLGGVEYDDDAALYVGADFVPNGGNKAELLLIAKEDREDHTDMSGKGTGSREKEGLVIANRIHELMRDQLVVDKDTGDLRPVQYRDIVILTRSIKGYADVFAGVLKTAGIPVYAGTKEGYFETQEIGVLLDYLRILNNRRQDIPLAAVLKSCFCGLTDEELAIVKGSYRENRFYDAVWKYAQEGEAYPIREKLMLFFEQLEGFRRKSKYMALHELLRCIVEETGYWNYMCAFPDGEQRKANLSMLLEKAGAFESTSYKGVFHFIRYVEQLKKFEIDYGEANIPGEGTNAVRIMSIHKSKGLEFPVVIVAGMGKRFNRQDTGGNVVMHASLGVGLESIDLKERTKVPSFPKQVIAREEYMESTGEELRVLYVALTRAKEKLIMTGVIGEPEEKLAKAIAAGRGENGKTLSFVDIAGASSYLDWLLPAVGMDLENGPIDVRCVCAEDVEIENIQEAADRLVEQQALENFDTNAVYDEKMRKNLKEQFGFRYRYKNLEGRKLKYTVSELKKRAYLQEESGEVLYGEEEIIPLIPEFLQEKKVLSGASRGSAYHRVMELLDFTKEYDEQELAQTLEKMQVEGKISPEMTACIALRDIQAFLETKSCKRMKMAAGSGCLWKEQPFVLGIPMEEVCKDLQADSKEISGETVLVQGIIDVYFEEKDGLVVLDYKTDKVRNGRELLEKYKTQLEYYARALEQITGKMVKQKIIYSFTLNEEIIW